MMGGDIHSSLLADSMDGLWVIRRSIRERLDGRWYIHQRHAKRMRIDIPNGIAQHDDGITNNHRVAGMQLLALLSNKLQEQSILVDGLGKSRSREAQDQ